MRLHRVALFLLGWYLLLPPLVGESDQNRLSVWHQRSAWDTAAECRAGQDDYSDWANWAVKKGGPYADAPFRERTLQQAATSICVETGDPRLAR